jgi:hypothetical protein
MLSPERFAPMTHTAAIERHDTARLFDRLIHDFSFQGISDEIAANYMRRHGQATWRSTGLARRKLPQACRANAIFGLSHFVAPCFVAALQLPSADTAAMLFWALLASGQINMRKVDGWQTLATKPIDQPIDLAA